MNSDLNNHVEKCRFCFRMLKSKRKSIKIDQHIEDKFYRLTNLKLKPTHRFSSMICEACNAELKRSSEFQSTLIENQTRLYQHAEPESEEDYTPPLDDYCDDLKFDTEDIIVKVECTDETTVKPLEWIEVAEVDVKPSPEELLQLFPSSSLFTTKSQVKRLSSKRTEKSKRKYFSCYSQEDLKQAVEEVKSRKLTYSKASKKYNIPKTTIWTIVSGKSSNIHGGVPVLSQELEAELANWLIQCQSIGDPQTFEQARNAAAELAKRSAVGTKRFKNGIPSSQWLFKFIKRNPNVILGKKSSSIFEENVNTCDYCGTECETRLQLLNHMKIHSSEKLPPEYKCKFCPIVFAISSNKLMHEKRIHGAGHFSCLKCEMIFSVKRKLEDHNNAIHEPKIICATCGFTVAPGKEYDKHITYHAKHFTDNEVQLSGTKPGKRKYFSCYSQEDLKQAVEEVKSGKLTYSKASKKYNIPKSTLFNIVNGKSSNIHGGVPVLSQELEAELADWLIQCQSIGDPQTREQTRNAAAELAKLSNDKKKQFKNGVPTSDWVRFFIKRNPKISLRKTHTVISKSAEVFVCEYCERKCFSRQFLLHHLESHRRQEHMCGFCPLSFLESSSKLAHEKRLHGVGHFPCPKCDMKFSLKRKLDEHNSAVHEPKIVCESCGLLLAPGREYSKHVMAHKTNITGYIRGSNQKIKRGKYLNIYSKENLRKAVADVKSQKLTATAASKKYDVPETTIRNYVDGTTKNIQGRATNLNDEFEAQLANWIMDCQSKGEPRTKQEILNAAEGLAKSRSDERTKFKKGFPSKIWLESFIERNPQLLFYIKPLIDTGTKSFSEN